MITTEENTFLFNICPPKCIEGGLKLQKISYGNQKKNKSDFLKLHTKI